MGIPTPEAAPWLQSALQASFQCATFILLAKRFPMPPLTVLTDVAQGREVMAEHQEPLLRSPAERASLACYSLVGAV